MYFIKVYLYLRKQKKFNEALGAKLKTKEGC